MGSNPYASLYDVMYNPATQDLNMNLNSILNVDIMNPNTLTAQNVNVESVLNIQDTQPSGFQVSLTAMDLAGNASYNFPPSAGTDGQVLGLAGGSGQLAWYNVSGGVGGVSAVNGVAGAVSLQSMSLTITPDVGAGTIALDVNGILSLNDCIGVASIVSNTLAVSSDPRSNQITIDLSGVGVTSLNGLSGDVMIVSNTLAVSTDLSNQITIDFSGSVVTSLDGLSGDVIFTNSDGSIVGNVSGQTIDFVVAVPVPTGTFSGDYPGWDTSRGAYVSLPAPVTSLSAPTGDPNLSGPINFTTPNGSLTILGTYTDPNTIAFDVAVPVIAGQTNGDYPVWNTGTNSYTYTGYPVTTLTGTVGSIVRGDVTFTASGIIVDTTVDNYIALSLTTPLPAGTTTGDYPVWDSGTAKYVAQAPLPSGLAVPAPGDIGYTTFTINNVGAPLSSTSVVQATLQMVDDVTNPGACWLEYAVPGGAFGGSITFNFSDNISVGSTLKVAWAVIKY